MRVAVESSLTSTRHVSYFILAKTAPVNGCPLLMMTLSPSKLQTVLTVSSPGTAVVVVAGVVGTVGEVIGASVSTVVTSTAPHNACTTNQYNTNHT